MRYAFILTLPEHYGARSGGAIATVTRNLVRELVKLGNQTTVVTPDTGEAVYPEGNVICARFGPAHPRGRIRRKLATIRDRRKQLPWPDYTAYADAVIAALPECDVAVVHNDPLLATLLVRERPGIRVVLWLHNLLGGSDGPRLESLPSSVKVVAVSEAVADWTSTTHDLPRERISVINNGVDLDRFTPREGFANPVSPLRVVCHGRVDPGKGYQSAAAAVKRLRAEGVPVTFTLIGEVKTFGIDQATVDSYVSGLGRLIVEAEGEWLPRMSPESIASALPTYDVSCVLSTTAEPFPLTALESMASGCAVIGADSGGIPEALGQAGIIVEAGTVEPVYHALRSLASDPRSLGERKVLARRRAENFPWSAAAERLSEMLST